MFKRPWIGPVLALAIISNSGCKTSPAPVFVQDPLPIPDRPALPRIPALALTCLSDDAYISLVERDEMQAQHIRRLEAILKTTHN